MSWCSELTSGGMRPSSSGWAGSHRVPSRSSCLLRASAEFESLLSHYQKTLEMAELVAGRRLRRPVRLIAHGEAYAG